MKKNIKAIIVIAFIILTAITTLVNIRGSYLEYRELGEKYISIFKTNSLYKYCIIGINFIIIFLIIYLCGRGIKKGLKEFFIEEKREIPKLPNKSIAVIVSTIISVIVGIKFTPQIMMFINKTSFVQVDGVFNLDISYFMFVIPVIRLLIVYIIAICTGLIIYSGLYYILVFNKYFDGINRESLKNSLLIKKIIKYVRIIAICVSMLTIVRVTDIVYNNFLTTGSGLELIGAGEVDTRVKIVGNVILAIIIPVSIFYATLYIQKEKREKVLKSLLVIPAYMVMMFIVMFGFDVIFIKSNKYDREKQYIERSISYTKNAYGIDCESESIEYSGTITAEEVEKKQKTINNAVIISKQLALDSLNEEQNEIGYYTYQTAGIAMYKDNLVYISPKEISNTRRAYNSKTFEYTHGYGVMLTSATSISEDGGVTYIPSEIRTPQIYYGLETNNTAVTNLNSRDEYDYTDTKGTEYSTTYSGDGGISLNFIDRLILGLKTLNPNIAFSKRITDESKILINRNIVSRAKLALSGENIIYDENPYVIIDKNNDLNWVLDAYTISENYPYSAFINIKNSKEKRRINYIRNSIKVIINCYNGDMKFYITDYTDPIAMEYKKIYPKLFEDKNIEIPADISENFVYPKFLYNIQASIIEEYHNIKPEVLYRGDDSWKKTSYAATQNNKTISNTLDSYYTMVEDEDTSRIGLVQVYTPKSKQNIVSYLVGTVKDGTNKLKIYKFSSNETILGLTQLDSKISQDEIISEEIEKLNVTGAKVTKTMMAIPIDKTLLYIEQIYQTNQNESNIPKLKKVIVASGNKVAIGNNLSEAIENIVSKYATSIDTYTTDDIDGIIQSIIKANNNLTQSMDSKDLELIGSDVKKLQELINLLEKEKENERKVEDNENEDENENQNQNATDTNITEENKETV